MGTVVVVSPGPTEQWQRAEKLFPTQKVVYLNGALTETYDLGGPLSTLTQAYYVKRVSKGWVFRASPGPWKAYLEKPDGSIEMLKSYPEKPSLREVSALVRDTSMDRFGIFNDRFSPGFGARL
ncbi:unnamed protein product [Phaeothamnion confervicola]